MFSVFKKIHSTQNERNALKKLRNVLFLIMMVVLVFFSKKWKTSAKVERSRCFFQEMRLNSEETPEQIIERSLMRAEPKFSEAELDEVSESTYYEEAKASDNELVSTATEEESFEDAIAISCVEDAQSVEEATFVTTDQVCEIPQSVVEESEMVESEIENQFSHVTEEISEVEGQAISDVSYEVKEEETEVLELQNEFSEAETSESQSLAQPAEETFQLDNQASENLETSVMSDCVSQVKKVFMETWRLVH